MKARNRACALNANRPTGISRDKKLNEAFGAALQLEGRAGIEPAYKSLAKEVPYHLATAPPKPRQPSRAIFSRGRHKTAPNHLCFHFSQA